MHPSVEHASPADADLAPDPVVAAWSELKNYLDRRSRKLSEEIRSYPTPIARCDEQLTRLIEQRAQAMQQLGSLLDADPTQVRPAGGHWRQGLERLVRNPDSADDETEAALRARLTAALSGLRDQA